jgi:anti-sigma B factor antagonist
VIDSSGSVPDAGVLRIHREDDTWGVVLTLEGELDIGSAPELSRQLNMIEGAHPERILIDLGRLTFMDSTGLTVVVQANQSAKLNGHRLSFRNASPQVQRLLEITSLLGELTFER